MKDPEILTRVSQYEMAFKMQASVPDLVDMSKEPASVLEMYGAKPGDGSFASNCLLARRLAERGVRFIQLYHRDWDHHSGIKANIPIKAEETDKATAALITDLKQRGMLDDTIVIWGGEFGRTPMSQPTNSATPPSKIPLASTISTPRSCTCSASTTNVSPSNTKAKMPASPSHPGRS